MEDACPKREKAECKISAGNHIDLLEACSLSELLGQGAGLRGLEACQDAK